jgi:hypothetical protein
MVKKWVMIGLLGVASWAYAESPAPKTGKDVLERYIEVTGGRAAYEKFNTRASKGTLTVAAAGLSGALETWQAAPNSMYVSFELAGLGKTEQGTDGKIAWESSAITGARLLKDAEKAAFIRSADFHGELHPERNYKSIELVGTENLGDKPAYKLSMTTNEGDVETRWYDQETGLLVKMEATTRTQMGDIKSVSVLSDYREADGVKIPCKVTISQMGQEIVLATDQVQHNVEVPAGRFDPPAAVKALLEAPTAPTAPSAPVAPGSGN